MKMKKLMFFSLVFFLVIIGAAQAATWTICPAVCNYDNISAAVASGAVTNGDKLDIQADDISAPNITKDLWLDCSTGQINRTLTIWNNAVNISHCVIRPTSGDGIITYQSSALNITESEIIGAQNGIYARDDSLVKAASNIFGENAIGLRLLTTQNATTCNNIFGNNSVQAQSNKTTDIFDNRTSNDICQNIGSTNILGYGTNGQFLARVGNFWSDYTSGSNFNYAGAVNHNMNLSTGDVPYISVNVNDSFPLVDFYLYTKTVYGVAPPIFGSFQNKGNYSGGLLKLTCVTEEGTFTSNFCNQSWFVSYAPGGLIAGNNPNLSINFIGWGIGTNSDDRELLYIKSAMPYTRPTASLDFVVAYASNSSDVSLERYFFARKILPAAAGTYEELGLLESSISTTITVEVLDSSGMMIENTIIQFQRYFFAGSCPDGSPNACYHPVITAKTSNIAGSTNVRANTAYYKPVLFLDDGRTFTFPAMLITSSPVVFMISSNQASLLSNVPEGFLVNTTYNNTTENIVSVITNILGFNFDACLKTYNNTQALGPVFFNQTCSAGAASTHILALTLPNSNVTVYSYSVLVNTSTLTNFIIDAGIIDLTTVMAPFTREGGFLALFLLLPVAFAGLWNPAVAIFLTITALVFLSQMHFISIPISIIYGMAGVGLFLLWLLKDR